VLDSPAEAVLDNPAEAAEVRRQRLAIATTLMRGVSGLGKLSPHEQGAIVRQALQIADELLLENIYRPIPVAAPIPVAPIPVAAPIPAAPTQERRSDEEAKDETSPAALSTR
jgi:hypothetical protein